MNLLNTFVNLKIRRPEVQLNFTTYDIYSRRNMEMGMFIEIR